MPRVTAHTKSLAEQLGAANERIQMLEVDRKALQSENQVLRGEVERLKSTDEAKYDQILEKVNGLVSAVTFHLNANTMAINALSANIANLNAKRDT